MGEYNVDFGKFIGGLLPQALRGTVRVWAGVLCQPFKSLYARFLQYREDKLWSLKYNAQAVSMEAMLNDRFRDVLEVDANGRRILVVDGQSVPSLLVYPENEHLPVVVGIVKITSAETWGAAPFLVKIPVETQGDQNMLNQVDSLVRRYKLLGTKHVIVYY